MRTLKHIKWIVEKRERRNNYLGLLIVAGVILGIVSVALLEIYPSTMLALIAIAGFLMFLIGILLEKHILIDLSLGEKTVYNIDQLIDGIKNYNEYANKERDSMGRWLQIKYGEIVSRVTNKYSGDVDDVFMADYWAFAEALKEVMGRVSECIRTGSDIPTGVGPRLSTIVSLSQELTGSFKGSSIEHVLTKATQDFDKAGIGKPRPAVQIREIVLGYLKDWWTGGGSTATYLFTVSTLVWGMGTFSWLWPGQSGTYLMGFLMIFFGCTSVYFFVRKRLSRTE